MKQPGTVDAILMASGFSSRFGGGSKLLEPFGGRPLIAYTLDLMDRLEKYFSRVFLVAADPRILSLAEKRPIEPIENKNPGRGLCESIRLGVSASAADYYLFFPCDQPLLDERTVKTIIAKGQAEKIIVPEYRGKPGNPALFSSLFREELLGLKDGENPRIIKTRHPGAVVGVELESPLPLRDIDTPGDMEELLAFFR